MTKNIVVIDDDNDVLEAIKYFIETSNVDYHVLLFDNTTDAIHHIKYNKESINLLIIDIYMPQMTGIEMVYKLNGIDTIPVLFLTASENTDIIEEAYKLNGKALKIGYITKPFHELIFLSEVDTLISLQEKTLDLISQNRAINRMIKEERNKNEYLANRLAKILKDHEENIERIETIKNLIKNIFTNDLPIIKIIVEIIEGSKHVIEPIVKMADEEFFGIIPHTDEPLKTVAADLECIAEILLDLEFVTYDDLDFKNIEKSIFFNMLDKLYKDGKLETETFNKLLDKIQSINKKTTQVFMF